MFNYSVSLALSIVRHLFILGIKGRYISQPAINLMILMSSLIPEVIPLLFTVTASSSSEVDNSWILLDLLWFNASQLPGQS